MIFDGTVGRKMSPVYLDGEMNEMGEYLKKLGILSF